MWDIEHVGRVWTVGLQGIEILSSIQKGSLAFLILYLPSFSGGSDSKESSCNVGDPGSTPGSGRSPGEGNGNPLQYSCLENSMDRVAWWATLLEFEESDRINACMQAIKVNIRDVGLMFIILTHTVPF